VVEINRAVAVGMADGPQAELAILEPVLARGHARGLRAAAAAYADLLQRLGHQDEAAAAWARAAQAAGNTTLRRELRRGRGGNRVGGAGTA
jgi:predicted RNA polymerase sigma factor